jgi:uncharacterized protein (TIGR03435 family)
MELAVYGTEVILVSRVFGILAVVGAMCPALTAQTQSVSTEPVAFEVASVRSADPRENKPGDIPVNSAGSSGSFVMRNVPLLYLLEWAYDLKDYEITGPDWIRSPQNSYDIVAKAPGPASGAAMKSMLQTLLAERFQMKLHREKKTLDVYALLPGKGAPKVTEPAPDEQTDLTGSTSHTTYTKQPISRLAYTLTHRMDRPVIDLTGLNGLYDFTLDLSGLGVRNDPSEVSAAPSVFMSVQDNLGLRLQAQKATIDVLVVDHAEKIPTQN